jgi:hypothetical protein
MVNAKEKIDTSSYKKGLSCRWNEFLGEGIAKEFYTAGITNKGLDPAMLNDEGLAVEVPNKKAEVINTVIYDVDYVLEKQSKVLEDLNIIENGVLNESKLEWLFDKLVVYASGFATREADKVLKAQAQEMASKFPAGGDVDAWYSAFKANIEKPVTKNTEQPPAATAKNQKAALTK